MVSKCDLWIDKAIELKNAGVSWRNMPGALAKEYPGLALKWEQVRDAVRNKKRTAEGGQRSAAKRTGKPKPAEDEVFSDGTQSSTRILKMIVGKKYTPDEMLILHGFDPPGKWRLVSAKSNAWHGMTGAEEGNALVELRQSTVVAKPRANELTLEDVKQVFRELSREYQRPRIAYVKPKGDMMAEVNIADLHLGKLCWHGDTAEDYDYKIARRIFGEIVAEICEELKAQPIEKILFIAANDFFNSDTPMKTTTAGTPQDTDIRWQKLYKVGVAMLMDAVLALADIAPVEVLYTASNHDLTTMYHALCHLSDCRQIDPERVTVDTDAHARKYRLYGNTLIGFSHGDTERRQKRSALGALGALPPLEARELWAQAKYCEVHAAHLHCEQALDEVNGVIVRRISSPTASDTWHTESAYIGAVRKAQTFIYDREYGLIHTINTPVR